MSRYHRGSLAEIPHAMTFSHGELMKNPDDWEHTGDKWRIAIYDYEGSIEYKSEVYPFTPGAVFIFPPEAHFKQDRYDESLYVMYSNFKLSESGEQMMALPFSSHFGTDYESRHRDWHRSVRRLDLSAMPARAMVFHLLWMLAEPLAKYRKRQEVDDAESFMLKNISNTIVIDEVAKLVGVSQNQLIRLFRQEHGMTPISFLRNLRAERAKRLLATTSIPVKEVAAAVGIPNLHYFNAFIREYFGMGPRALRDEFQR